MGWATLLPQWRLVWRRRRRSALGTRRTRIVSSLRTALTLFRGMLTSARQATSRAVRAPQTQLLSAVAGMVGGAWLIAPWMVGIVLMLGSAAWGADALLRPAQPRRDRSGHEEVLERWRRAA